MNKQTLNITIILSITTPTYKLRHEKEHSVMP